jgi:hypothetical protein
MDPSRTIVMACATVIEEMLPLLPVGMAHQVFDFGLHVNPEKLRRTLQEAIDAVSGQYETILLGYGLCSQAMIGIRANGCTLVVPLVDDCISIFLGSHSAYLDQARAEPGTYYLTKGWIEVGDTPFSEFERVIQKYGQARAERLYHVMMANYKRLALIDTGQYELERYRDYARGMAERFNLRYDEIRGSAALIEKLLGGDWAEEFVVVQPGGVVQYQDFYP